MDVIGDDVTREVVLMWPGQVGKTEVGINNPAGYYIHQEPCPIMVVQPTLEMAESWSKDRLAPMLRDCPVFAGLVKEARTRDSGNTLLHKKFPGGQITIAGANSPVSLASRPIRVLLMDELDSFELALGDEGDPIKLAIKRTETFWNKKIVKVSTPKKPEGVSRIERDFEAGDQRRFWVPCPACGTYQTLEWKQVKWPEDRPEETYYKCPHCEAAITEADKLPMLRQGEWRAEKEFRGIASFHINALYSPWLSWAEMAAEFLDAKKSRETLVTFINLYLAETWKDTTTGVNTESLVHRKENWGEFLPTEVLVLTAGVDVQDNRLEVELVGWGEGEESWSVEYRQFLGNPAEQHVWEELDAFLQDSWPSEAGHDVPVSGTAIDTGGHHTAAVLAFCAKRRTRRIFAIKGSSQAGRPPVTKPSFNNKDKVPLWLLGVDALKELVMTRLNIHQPGFGYCHFPAHYGQDYFDMLTAEVRKITYRHGVAVMRWEKKKGQARNEALDCRVYATAALRILGVNFEKLKAEMVRKKAPAAAKKQEEKPSKNSWLGNTENWLDR